MKKKRVYVESTVISYLTASMPSDVLQLARQKATRDWWALRDRYCLYISPVVTLEIQRGDPSAVRRRLESVTDFPILPITDGAVVLADHLVATGAIPAKVKEDALHIAVAAVHGMDYLVTWNQKHLVNPRRVESVYIAVRQGGWTPPVLLRPDDWQETENDGE